MAQGSSRNARGLQRNSGMSPSSAPAWRPDNIGRGIVLTLSASMIFGVQDAVAKILVSTHPQFQITMLRYWAFAVFSLALVWRQGPLRQAFRSKAPGLQVLRGVLLVFDIWLFATAIITVPLGELQAIALVYPLMVTLFAIPLLGEKVGVFRLTAVAVGFGGALIIVRPGGLEIGVGVICALCSSVCYSLYIVLTRKVSGQDSTATSMFYVGLVGLVLTTAVGVFFWEPLDWQGWMLVAVVMATTCVAHGLMMSALSMAPASALQPFNYFSLPWAIVLSVAVFGHMIDPMALLGAIVIVGAGLAVMARERRKALVVPVEAPRPGAE